MSLPLTQGQAAVGDLDTSFGVGGKVTLDLGIDTFPTSEKADAIVVQRDGKIVVAGAYSGFGIGGPVLVRFNTNGGLDSTFGTGGKALPRFASGVIWPSAIVLQQDGKMLVGGTGFAGSVPGGFTNPGLGAARFNADGSIDTTYGAGGLAVTEFGQGILGLDAALQADGKLIVVGAFGNDFAYNFATVRYNADGSLDTSFGTGGKIVTDFLDSYDIAFAVAVQSDGKIVVAGTGSNYTNPPFTGQDFALVRFNADGSLDNSFGTGGKVLTDFSTEFGLEHALYHDEAHDIAIQRDGKIVLAGSGAAKNFLDYGNFVLARFNSDGSLDTNFGSGGKVSADYSGSIDWAENVVLQENGKIVIVGHRGFSTDFPIGAIFVSRYSMEGSLDTGFGAGGNVFTKFKNGSDEEVEDTVIQSDGKIIIAGGYNDIHTGDDIALARFEGDPPPPAFDICLQDDGGGNLLQFNSTTGDYQFTTCSGFTIGGRGVLSQRGSTTTLQHNSMDRRVLAMIDTGRWKGTASVRSLTLGHTFTITDRDARNNTCACR